MEGTRQAHPRADGRVLSWLARRCIPVARAALCADSAKGAVRGPKVLGRFYLPGLRRPAAPVAPSRRRARTSWTCEAGTRRLGSNLPMLPIGPVRRVKSVEYAAAVAWIIQRDRMWQRYRLSRAAHG